MNEQEKSTISQIRGQVNRVEGFDIKIVGKRKLLVNLHDQKQTHGEMLVSTWISENFPDVEIGVVFVLFGKGRLAKRSDALEKVRESYPDNFKLLAKQKSAAEKTTANATIKLKEKNKAIRQVKSDLKRSVQQTALKINSAQKNAEHGAAYEALDKALRKKNMYHERVKELCETAILDGLYDTQAIIERILAAWSLAEKEKDRFGIIGNVVNF